MKNTFKSLVNLIGKGHQIVLFDVGAMGGTPRKWLPLREALNVIGFEPDSREFVKLGSSGTVRYFNYALNNKTENLTCYITQAPGRSSIFRPNMDVLGQYNDEERFNLVREEAIPASKVKEIDFVMNENSITDADFIKIDTQGSELQIMQGGEKRLIPKIFGLQVEVEFIEMYKNQPVFRDIDRYLDSKGFVLIDLKRNYWKRKEYYQFRGKGQLVFADALYFKKIEVFNGELALLNNPSLARAKILKSILICMIYKMFDYAVGIANSGVKAGYLSQDECARVVSIIKTEAQSGFPAWVHIGRAYYIISSIIEQLKPPSYMGWGDSDLHIGNTIDL